MPRRHPTHHWLASAALLAAVLAPGALRAHPSDTLFAERPQAATPEELRECKKPIFPTQALRTDQKGDVTLAFLVDVDGKVIDAVVRRSSKHELLDDSAKAGILRCRFKPRTINGHPASSWLQVTYHWTIPIDQPTAAMQRYRDGALKGDLEAFYQLALTFRSELNDDDQAIVMLREAARNGHPGAIHELADAAWHGRGLPQDQPKALSYYMSAAELGHAQSQFEIGAAYANGLGVQRNQVKAMAWFDKAAQQGFVDAQTALGDAYASGVTGAPDHQAALGWYRKAAQAGDDLAQCKLGQSYLAGLGVGQDPAQAAMWLRKAADQRMPRAEGMLAALYLEGRGVPMDQAEARKLANRAATGGDAAAMVLFGDLLAREGDPATAAMWYRRAADRGDDGAIQK